MRSDFVESVDWDGRCVDLIMYFQEAETSPQDMSEWIKAASSGGGVDYFKPVAKRLAECIEFVHENLKCCHLDIKPENAVMFLEFGKGYDVKLSLTLRGGARLGNPSHGDFTPASTLPQRCSPGSTVIARKIF